MVSTANLCLICKGGRNLCGHSPCPLLVRSSIKPKIETSLSTDFFGEAPSVFIGRTGYPNVYTGPTTLIESNIPADNPDMWFGRPYQEIIEMRSLVMRSKQKQNIFSRSRFIQDLQDIAMSSRSVDVEMHFSKKPVYRVSFSDVVQPMGPSAPLKKFRLAENPRIPRVIDKVVNDELKATEAGFLLYSAGVSIHKIMTLFSAGTLGIHDNRKLVPTRFSITGIDDIIGKHLMKRIRTYPSINEYEVYESRYLDNHFVILLIPGQWEFENFEAWSPGSFWSQSLKQTQILVEYEPFRGRTKYAELQAGGYYASRFACVEHLHSRRRQARVVVFREVSEGYVVPLGVWVVRSTAKDALAKKPLKFSTKEEALRHIDTLLNIPLQEYLKRSRILRQSRLSDYLAPLS